MTCLPARRVPVPPVAGSAVPIVPPSDDVRLTHPNLLIAPWAAVSLSGIVAAHRTVHPSAFLTTFVGRTGQRRSSRRATTSPSMTRPARLNPGRPG
jgi:hypothetical protein